jgi:multimeric flavodoxin WrbA
MKLLFISGALRRHGSTEGALERCVEHLRTRFPDVEPEIVHLCDGRVDRCDSCYSCDEKRACWMGDDVAAVVQKMIFADGIVYAFPVHAFGVNSLMQEFLERAGVGYLRFSRPLENKVAGIIVTGRRYAHEMAWAQVAMNVMLNRMVLVGSGFPGAIKNDGKALGEDIQDGEGLTAVLGMLDKMVWFLRDRVGRVRPQALRVVS